FLVPIGAARQPEARELRAVAGHDVDDARAADEPEGPDARLHELPEVGSAEAYERNRILLAGLEAVRCNRGSKRRKLDRVLKPGVAEGATANAHVDDGTRSGLARGSGQPRER